jgi:putative membrane-bound dehydrogenase-like protein
MNRFESLGILLVVCLGGNLAAAPSVPAPLPGWRMELVAEAPRINHPSVVCTAPDGRVFVAEDPMDITVPANSALGRIVCFHPDGRVTIFAEKLYAVFGMQYLEGKLYVLHNPRFSVFTDDAGVGKDRVDLIEQTNPNPWALDWNDHVPANFRLAMDGYFYVAVGDKGLYQCKGRDGSEVNLHGGGILRLRPDATGLEIFSTGVRNILDVALDADDELFTYDNTDEHQWMGRLTHMVDGGFYGYPHDFIPRRPYTLWMMHDFGAGAACGALAYTDDALPPEYHGNLFLADFGKRQITRVQIERAGGSFRVVGHSDLFPDPPPDFRPVGLAFAPDGLSLYICDWQHRDVKAKEAKVGRLWKLTWAGKNHSAPKPTWHQSLAFGQSAEAPTTSLLGALSHPSRAVRLTAQRALVRAKTPPLRELAALVQDSTASVTARRHAIWTLDLIDQGQSARKEILSAAMDRDAGIARQAIRQLGQRRVAEASRTLRLLLRNSDASLRFHAATALGRLADTNAIPALALALAVGDLFARHAAFTALNRIGRAQPAAWPAIVRGLDSPDARLREATAFALRETFAQPLVDALQPLATDHARRVEVREGALKALAALHHQPPEWRGEWWAYHPAKAPAPERTVAWAGTEIILRALREALTGPEPRLRLVAAEGLGEARDPSSAGALRELLDEERDAALRGAALRALARLKDGEAAPLIAALLRNERTEPALLGEAIRLTPQFEKPELTPALVAFLQRPSAPAGLRLEGIEALARIGGTNATAALRALLKASPAEERRAAIRALGQLRDKAAVPELLDAWKSPDTRAEALAALGRVSDLRALDAYLDGLASADPAVREHCRKALTPIRAEALAQVEARTAAVSATALAELRRVYADDAEALKKPFFATRARTLELSDYERFAQEHAGNAANGQRVFFNEQGVACIRCHLVHGQGGAVGPDLTLAGAQFSRAQLVESILHPSRAVREGYQQIIIETMDGEEVSGALKADTADGVTLVDAAGRTHLMLRATIAHRRTSALSLMPEGLHVGLTLEEFADLIAYLESLKAAKPKSPR